MKQREENLVITIGREYGSGGRSIAIELAKVLGIKYYDKELMAIAAKDSGLKAECFEHVDEKTPGSFLSSLASNFFHLSDYNNAFNDEKLFQFQSDAIKRVADESDAVIVGRCSDYILRNRSRMISIFLHAPIKSRIKTVSERESLSEREALERIKSRDKERAAYYNFYSDKTWGKASTYMISLDSSVMSIEENAQTIAKLIKKIDRL